MNFKTLSVALAATFLSALADAQGHIPGQFIVQFHHDLDAAKFAKEYGLVHLQDLSPRAHVDLLAFPAASTNADDWEALRAMRQDGRLEAVQFNHVVEERETVPNDPSFGQQWHHVQGGDHDIDTDLAWDITTGGSAANGARIVVAVLEGGGSNYNHVDLIGNHWVNDAEIPGNGIDDDENGFVDDYNGWNATNNSDNIAAGGHGTSVSGMIGATGDNGVGGVGVNWDVEIMQVQMGGLSESNVIAAYNYPYEMRALYNQTGGARGAFVVATNASWGIDLANPANYPVWCGYYDDLGEQGILNCGATANAAYNIDTQGDMPTGCSSPYMVAVTATNNNDVRTFSGYGATTIDLGAPGESVYLPSGSSGYGNTSGTSFASPCVAGAIALVYSAPCPDLMGLALSNPQAAADLVMGYIYDGTDEVSNLVGETVTGGRLNAFNALNLAMANCGPLECEPDSIYASTGCVYDASLDTVVTELELGVELSSFLCATSTVCVFTDADSLGWVCDSLAINSGSTYTFSGLYPDANYSFYYTIDTLQLGYAIDVQTPACDELVPGCTGPTAYNFDPLATIDDGSCEFPCIDFTLTIETDCWPEEVGWELVLEGEEVVASVATGEYTEEQAEYTFAQCLTEGCYTLTITDDYGDGLNGAAWGQCGVDGYYEALDSSGTVLFFMEEANYGEAVTHQFCLPAIPGCTDEGACNFNADANTNDGSCFAPGDACDDGDDNTIEDVVNFNCECIGVQAVFGCTDDDACNYNPEANVDDDSCYYLGVGSIVGPLFPDAGDTATYMISGALGTSFEWSVDGGELLEGQGAEEVVVVWGQEAGQGTIEVVETDGSGCEGEIERTVQILATSNVNVLDTRRWELMPNPAKGVVRLAVNGGFERAVEVTLIDLQGRVALSVNSQDGQVALDGVQPGLYAVKVNGPLGQTTLSLVVAE